jgi:outer membrane biosynthesis protein TonB
MFGGFDPVQQQAFFERRRRASVVWALLLLGLIVGWSWWSYQAGEEVIEVDLADQVQDFDVEDDEPEAEPEPEEELPEEPPPPPPPNVKTRVVDEIKPTPEVGPPEQIDDTLDESDDERVVDVVKGAKDDSTGTGTKPVDDKPDAGPAPEKKDPPPPEKKTVVKRDAPIDPTQFIDRPLKASTPVCKVGEGGNPAPEYPKKLRDEGVTGSYKFQIKIFHTGQVKGAKLISKSNTASTEAAKEEADTLFKKAILAVLPKWTCSPATFEGKPISVFHTVTIPFSFK